MYRYTIMSPLRQSRDCYVNYEQQRESILGELLLHNDINGVHYGDTMKPAYTVRNHVGYKQRAKNISFPCRDRNLCYISLCD